MNLSVTSLDLLRNGRPVQTGLSFEVPAGQAMFLRGPNGVGKTSLLRALAGLLPLSGGEVHLGRTSLQQDRDGFTEKVALTGHLDAVKPPLTVAETLRFWAGLHGFDGDMNAVLEDYALTDLSERLAGRLSAGQRRRLGLARLPLTGARLWLMDEPANSLDTDSTARLGARIDRHLETGGLAVIATHINIPLQRSGSLTLSPPAPSANIDPFLDGAFA